jgi:acyl-CoA reductase-like NAD-dependent aldehyde dehydrogenase
MNEKTVLITGSSTGFGHATAKLFADKGWNVVATMRDAGRDNMLVSRLDVADPASIDQTIKTSIERFGKLDTLINNAGYGHMGYSKRFPKRAYRVTPTVFVNVKNDMTIAQEEIFGPVLCVITYDSEDEAIRIANDSKYGLHAPSSGPTSRARRVASQIRAGRVVINGMTDDPQAPWGGFKYSGGGREYGRYGIEAFLETRAVLES